MKHLVSKILVNVLLALAISAQTFAGTSALCETGHANQMSFLNRLQIRVSTEFSLITWNAHKLADKNFIPDLIELSKNADLILIQEAMHNANLQKTLTHNFNFSFSFNKSFCNLKNEATGVMNISRYLLEYNLTLVSPDTEPITFTPKVSAYSAINIPEIGIVHIINTHGLNFNFGDKFERQIDQLTEFISQLQGPVIWAGDFNTWSNSRQHYLDSKARALGLSHATPKNDQRILILDHIYTRGLEPISIEVLKNIQSSDHLPIRVSFKKI